MTVFLQKEILSLKDDITELDCNDTKQLNKLKEIMFHCINNTEVACDLNVDEARA